MNDVTLRNAPILAFVPNVRGLGWARRSRQCKLSLVALLSILTLVCAGCGGSPLPSDQATPIGTPPGRLLFQSDWTHGLEDWKPSAGWTLTNGVLQSSTADSLSLTLPYQPSVSNYAVEFQLLIVSVPRPGGSFALNVPPQSDSDGFSSGVSNLLPAYIHQFARHPMINVLINPANKVGTAGGEYQDYEHQFKWHTYLVQVTGNTATIFTDGHRRAYGTSQDTSTLSNGPLQFECAAVQLQLAWFHVYAL